MNMNDKTPSPDVQALIAARYSTRPGCVTPVQYEDLKRTAKQFAREISAELRLTDPDFHKTVDKSRALASITADLCNMSEELRLQTPNGKLPRPYLRQKIDHADEIEKLLLRAMECLNYGESRSELDALFRRTLDAHFLVKDAFNEFNRVQGA